MLSEDLLVREAKRRSEVFRNLSTYLKKIADVVARLDPNAEIYLFGSVVEDKHLLSSDIDVLVVTEVKPGELLAALWREGIKDPFEIHVVTREMLNIYKRRAKLTKIEF